MDGRRQRDGGGDRAGPAAAERAAARPRGAVIRDVFLGYIAPRRGPAFVRRPIRDRRPGLTWRTGHREFLHFLPWHMGALALCMAGLMHAQAEESLLCSALCGHLPSPWTVVDAIPYPPVPFTTRPQPWTHGRPGGPR